MAKAKKTASKAVKKSERRSSKVASKRYLWMVLGIIAILVIGGIVWLGLGKPKVGEAVAAPGKVCSSTVPCVNTQYGTSGQTTKWCRQNNRGAWQWMWCAKCGTSAMCSNNNYYATSFSYGQTSRCENKEYICDDDNNWVQCNSANVAANKQVQIVSGSSIYVLQCRSADGYYKWVQVSVNVKAPQPDLTPDAAISASPISGYAPLTSGIQCSATGGDSPLSYKLIYGDGQSITGTSGISQNHAYTTAGTFTATCAVTDADGDYDTATATIMTSKPPVVCNEYYPCSNAGALWCGASYTYPLSTGSASYSYTWCTDSDNDGCLEISFGNCPSGFWCTSGGVCTKQ